MRRLVLLAAVVLMPLIAWSSNAEAQSGGTCNTLCSGGDAAAGPGGLEVDAGVDGGPSGGGPEQSFVRGPGHDPCTYRSLSAHGLLAWHISYSYQGNDDPPEPAPDQYYGDDPDARWALAHCPANAGRDVLVWWPVGGRPPASLIDALRQRARDAVPFPVLAQRAAPIAASTCSGEAVPTSAIVSSVAGFSTASGAPAPAILSPPMSSFDSTGET